LLVWASAKPASDLLGRLLRGMVKRDVQPGLF